MTFQELLVLLPCHGFEDFPHHHEGDDAESLLACWTSMWHPLLLADAGQAPSWARVDDPPEQLAGRLILVPTISSGELPTGFAQRASDEGAVLIRKPIDRWDILSQALAKLETPEEAVDEDLVADFLALGYGYLQIQILTRQMRYSSNLDEVHFNNQLLEAARLAVAGDAEAARAKIGACFDLLAEERDHFYAVDAYLVDVTLTAATTLGEPLVKELSGPSPGNILITGEQLDEMARNEPATLSLLKTAIDEDRWGLIGGEATEPPLPLMPLESILAEFRRGQELCQQHLGRPANVFGRMRFGLSPTLPQLLEKLDFTGAVHATLGDGRFPQGTQVKTRWEGVDGTGIDALAKVPLDAARAETFLGLAARLSESMDMDHVATIALAHWPGHASPWYEDLRRCAKYSGALGRFVTLERYFRDTYAPGQYDRFDADDYRAPYLKQAVIRRRSDPISTGADFLRRRLTADSIQTLNTLAALVSGDPGSQYPTLEELASEVDRHVESPHDGRLESHLAEAKQAAEQRLADLAPRDEQSERPGYLIWNPLSFARRVTLDVTALDHPPNVAPPVYAAGQTGETKHAVVDLPPMGYVWIESGSGPAVPKRGTPPLAEDCVERDGMFVLRNEFFEALVHPDTGSLQSLKDYASRGNRMSQQLALRQPGPRPRPGDTYRAPDETADYSVMAADEVSISHANPALGEIKSRGRLLDRKGEMLAKFQQTYRVVRGSRVLQVEVEIEPHFDLPADPWSTYFACRFAWADETSELVRGHQQMKFPLNRGRRFEATDYVEVAAGEQRTSIFTGGLAYHRLVGSRMLDSLLIVRGESCQKFSTAIGVDVAQPLYEALSRHLVPDASIATASPPKPATAWLFHFDSKQVIATWWSPLVEEGVVVGFRARILETSGRSTRTRLSAMRPIAAAHRLNFVGKALGEFRLDDGRAVIELSSFEWVEIEARWA